jgi:hypothetical protein
VSAAVRAAAALAIVAHAGVAGQVTRERDLQFGLVLAGATTSVLPTAPEAANWRVHYTLLALASSLQLTLPGQLNRVGGGASMPISFCSSCAIWRRDNANPIGGTTFNPASSVGLGLISLGSNIYVWLGGSVSPPPGQPGGNYSGTVVLTISGVVL